MARMVIGQETNMALDYGIKEKTLELKVRCELDGIPKALITTWWRRGSRSFVRFKINND